MAENAITLCEVQLAHAWDVRGDAREARFLEQVQASFGLDAPMAPASAVADGERALLRLAPKSWLFLSAARREDFLRVRDALNAAGGAVFDVSSSYVAWKVSGPAAARVLNRACPLDLHPGVFRPGTCAQSLLGHVNAIYYRPAEATFVVLVARSFSAHAGHHLRECAQSEHPTLGDSVALGEVLQAR